MKITWHEEKRQSNLAKHGLDFTRANKVFAGATFTFEDNRFDYGEQRLLLSACLMMWWSSCIQKQQRKSG